MYYVPFYRYAAYEPKIGFREMFLSAVIKGTQHLDHGGYLALHEPKDDMLMENMTLKLTSNKYYDEIKKICADHNIPLLFITTPVCDRPNTEAFFKSLEINYPEIRHFEYALQDSKYFSSCGHLNDLGARVFTRKLVEVYKSSANMSVRSGKANAANQCGIFSMVFR